MKASGRVAKKTQTEMLTLAVEKSFARCYIVNISWLNVRHRRINDEKHVPAKNVEQIVIRVEFR